MSHQDADLPPQEEERLIKQLFDERRSQQPVSQRQPDVPPKPPTTEEMRRELVTSIAVEDSVLQALARQRSEQVQAHMVGEGKLNEERVFLTEVDLAAADHEKIRTRLNITAGS